MNLMHQRALILLRTLKINNGDVNKVLDKLVGVVYICCIETSRIYFSPTE